MLKQFDELKREQQDRLERVRSMHSMLMTRNCLLQLRVPSFCVTSEPVILERQRRVLSSKSAGKSSALSLSLLVVALEGMLEEIQVDE